MPVTASSSSMRRSSPSWTNARERKSIQTDCPRPASSCNLDFIALHLLLHGCDLRQAGHVPLAAVELRAEEDGDELARDGRADDLRAEAEHVHVVVLDRLVGAVEVVADRRADAGHLAGGDRGAGARAADEDAALGLAALDLLADLARLVRVVDTDVGAVGAEVDHLVALERLRDGVAQVDATVVEGDGDPHGPSLPPRLE